MSPEEQYKNYLQEHIANVEKGYRWFAANYPNLVNDNIKDLVEEHDQSKWGDEEWQPYVDHFYGDGGSKDDFDAAWLHHLHHNPHHWQYWILVNDDTGTYALEMPFDYVIEMILDWWSFSWKKGNLSEIFDWYEGKKKDNVFIFHPETQKLVEDILNKMKKKLS